MASQTARRRKTRRAHLYQKSINDNERTYQKQRAARLMYAGDDTPVVAIPWRPTLFQQYSIALGVALVGVNLAGIFWG